MPNSQTDLEIKDNDIINKKKENINKKEELICNYYKEIAKDGDINRAKKKIEEFKKQLLTDTSIIEGKITALNKAISNTEFTDDLEEKNREFKKVAEKVLSGTQLKQDVYEEKYKFNHAFIILYFRNGIYGILYY